MKKSTIENALVELETGIEAYRQLLDIEGKLVAGLEPYHDCSMEALAICQSTPAFAGFEGLTVSGAIKRAYEYLRKLLRSVMEWIERKFNKDIEEQVKEATGEFMAAADVVPPEAKHPTPDVNKVVREANRADIELVKEIEELFDELNEQKKDILKESEERLKAAKDSLGDVGKSEDKPKTNSDLDERLKRVKDEIESGNKFHDELEAFLKAREPSEVVAAADLVAKTEATRASQNARINELVKNIKDLEAKYDMSAEELSANTQLVKGYVTILKHYQRKRRDYIRIMKVGTEAAKKLKNK